jgi:hypothetical protein
MQILNTHEELFETGGWQQEIKHLKSLLGGMAK